MSSSSERVQEIFLQVVRLKGSERGAFLDRACGSDRELRRQVELLLKHHFSKTILPRGADTVQVKGNRDGLRKLLNSLSTRTLSRQFTPEKRRVVIAAGVYLGLILGTLLNVRSLLRARIAEEMQTGLNVIADRQVEGVKAWLGAEKRMISFWAALPATRDAVQELNRLMQESVEAGSLEKSREGDPVASQRETLQRQLLGSLSSLRVGEYEPRFAVWNLEGVLIADSTAPQLIGNRTTEYGATMLVKVFHGETRFWLPTRKGYITRGFQMEEYLEQPEMAIIAPVFNGQGRVIAAMLVSGLGLEERFNKLLAGIAIGDTGETYAFDREGYLLSETRYSKSLGSLGLLPDDSSQAFWNLRLANPGVDLTLGRQPIVEKEEWPLTRMAAAATSGRDGHDVEGYADYRGRPVIGAWRWIREYDFGLAVEIDEADAYRVIGYVWWAFAVLLGCTVLIPGWVLLQTLKNTLSQGQVPDQLGVYTLGEKIGEGGIGQVYHAVHSLLKRPTAIKVLKPEQISETARTRFEREVRLAAQLDHPNTIEIYDYGEDTAGRLYYAMEYVDGLTLSQLIEKTGVVPAERTVFLLKQVCLSLREAHGRGLVHRDIKPQNIMVCCRGGEADVVKVLDFGLVKQFVADESASLTNSGILVGTPMYISPERLRDPGTNDPQSDVYSLGVVAFEMLAGQAPFPETDPASILHDTIFASPRDLRLLLKEEVPRELVQLIMACLQKSPEQRPQSMDQFLELLEAIPMSDGWTQKRARIWWRKYGTPSQVQSLPRVPEEELLSGTRSH